MIAEHFTRRWQRAGLIDAALAERILAWEAAHRRPVFLWALAGMGALAVSLGVLAIVGANWEDIPAAAKLAVDLGLNTLCAIAVFVFWRGERVWLREIAALLLFGLVLSGIALIGQVYQLQSAPWHALLLWLALSTPFLALTAWSRLVGVIWAIAAVTTWFATGDVLQTLLASLGVLTPRPRYVSTSDYLVPLLGYLAACWMILVAVMRSLWRRADAQAEMLLRLGLALLIVACSGPLAFGWRSNTRPIGLLLLAAIATVAAAVALRLGNKAREWRADLMLLGGSFVFWAAGLLVTDMTGKAGDVVRAILFILYWAGIGGIAGMAGWRSIFGLAFTMIGLRLMVLYFEAIGGLTATGLGLIGGGVLCLLLVVLGLQLMRRLPRPERGTA